MTTGGLPKKTNPMILNSEGFSHAFALVLAVGDPVAVVSEGGGEEECKMLAFEEADAEVLERASDENGKGSVDGVGEVAGVGRSRDVGDS